MGGTLSNLTEGANGSTLAPGLGDIPESCVACVFMYLTPPEICNLARLNRAFRGASSSDSVWESKLPPNYQDLLHLMPPERVTGKVCMSISAKAMTITGIEDRRYWNWIPTEESRFQFDGVIPTWYKYYIFLLYCGKSNAHIPTLTLHLSYYSVCRFHVVAYLQQIWWFELDGVVKFPFPSGIYTLLFRLHLGRFTKRLGRRVSNFEHTHGWDIKPVQFELSTSDGQQAACECCLDESEEYYANGNHKRGSWIEYMVGEFIVCDSQPVTEVKFSMKQIDCTHSKGGLCVDSVFIVPSDLRGRRRRRIEVWK
ncbi:hypothetical protein HHK36_011289 [Tetracentron sinense]|uniref:F-box domain-containing protein n=1 Tax=Tetracentron sinense TaxID=13715 RepID=A0A834ZG06_TETSI|nr:hypothetical protein HHK36_011289 [Tetracentron sinense]